MNDQSLRQTFGVEYEDAFDAFYESLPIRDDMLCRIGLEGTAHVTLSAKPRTYA